MTRNDRIRQWFLWGVAAFTVFLLMGQVAGPLHPPPAPPVPTAAPPLPTPAQTVCQETYDAPDCPGVAALAPAVHKPTIAIEAPPISQPSGAVRRIGATCHDGSPSSATGSGACSHHGGVRSWMYAAVAPVSPGVSTRLCGGTRYIGNRWNKLLFPPGTDIRSIDPYDAACFDSVASAVADGYELRQP